MARQEKVGIIMKATDEASKVFNNVANNTLPQFAKRVAQLATSFASVAAVERVLSTAITNALEAEKAISGLTAALRAQGDASLGTVRGLTANAEALSRLSLASDEAIIGAQQILVSVGQLKGGALDAATKSALDLAAGLGIELPQAATILAKAAQGSTRELTRLGFEFTKGASDAQVLQEALAQVQARFAGMAEAEIRTASGQIHEFNEAIGELLETLGTKLIGGVDGINELTRAVQALNDESNKPGGIGFFKSILVIAAGIATGTAGSNMAALAAHAAVLTANLDAAIKAEQAIANFQDPFGAWSALAAENAKRAADQAERAAAAAKKLSEAIAKINERTSIQIFQPEQRKPKTPITGESSDFVLKQIADESDAVVKEQEAYQKLSDEVANTHFLMLGLHEASTTWAEEMTATLQGGLQNAAAQFGETMVAAAFGAKVSWSDTIKQILAGLAQVLVRTAIIKAIEIAFVANKGGIVPSNMMAEGGVVYAAGGFRPRGTDTVPAMLTPGEMVIPRAATQAILGGRASLVGGGGGGGPQLVTVKLGGATMTRLLVDNARSVVEVLDYIDARGR